MLLYLAWWRGVAGAWLQLGGGGALASSSSLSWSPPPPPVRCSFTLWLRGESSVL